MSKIDPEKWNFQDVETYQTEAEFYEQFTNEKQQVKHRLNIYRRNLTK